MVLDGSLPYSKNPATYPCPVSDQFSPLIHPIS